MVDNKSILMWIVGEHMEYCSIIVRDKYQFRQHPLYILRVIDCILATIKFNII